MMYLTFSQALKTENRMQLGCDYSVFPAVSAASATHSGWMVYNVPTSAEWLTSVETAYPEMDDVIVRTPASLSLEMSRRSLNGMNLTLINISAGKSVGTDDHKYQSDELAGKQFSGTQQHIINRLVPRPGAGRGGMAG